MNTNLKLAIEQVDKWVASRTNSELHTALFPDAMPGINTYSTMLAQGKLKYFYLTHQQHTLEAEANVSLVVYREPNLIRLRVWAQASTSMPPLMLGEMLYSAQYDEGMQGEVRRLIKVSSEMLHQWCQLLNDVYAPIELRKPEGPDLATAVPAATTVYHAKSSPPKRRKRLLK